MKKVEAIIKASRVDKMKACLRKIGLNTIVLSEIESEDPIPEVRLHVIVDDQTVLAAVTAMRGAG